MSRAYKRAGPPVPPTVTDKHASECNLHGSTDRTPSCAGINTRGSPCNNRITTFRPGLWPVCGRHVHVNVPAARCKAIADCGQTCGRLVKADSSFNLCSVHEKGTDTLPCYLLNIPTEIRVDIFRRLLPESVPSCYPLRGPDGEKSSYTALLRMNKQINREASSVLYERVPFNVDISEYHIHICNMEYTLGGIFGEGPKWSSLSRSWWSSDAHESAGFPKFILRIRNFRFNLNFNSPTGSFLPDTSDGITREDIHVLNLRNSVRELSNACISGDNTVRRPKDAIIQLEIHPTDNCDNHWAGDETLAALALVTEPLRLMGPVCRAIMHGFTTEKFWLPVPHPGRGIDTDWFKTEYRKFQSEWSGMMKTQTNTQSTLNRCTAEWTKKEIIAKAQLNVIKEILKVFLGKGLVTRHSSCSGAFDPIKGIDLVVYVSQLACEQYDLKALEMIQHILKDLWVKFCRGAQESLCHVTDSLLQVVEDPTGRLGMIKDHLEALALRADKPTYQTLRSLWLELVKRENEWTPGPGSRLVSEDRLRRYYILDPGVRGNSEPLPYCVLKTPRVVRATRGT